MTIEEIKNKIDDEIFYCNGISCDDCVFKLNESCGGTTRDFNFQAIKQSDITELHELLNFKTESNNNIYPKLPKRTSLIEDLSNGKCILESNGNPDDVRKVLLAAYPTTNKIYCGTTKYYWNGSHYWCNVNDLKDSTKDLTNLPIINTNEFLKELNLLPEKWCVEYDVEVAEWLNENSDLPPANRIDYKKSNFKYFVYPSGNKKSHIHDNIPSGYTLITIEQFRNFLNKKTMKNRFPFTLKQEDAIKILNIACATWTDKLSKEWSPYIFGDNREVLIYEAFYKEMRSACDKKQNALFDEIFGKDEVEKFYKIGQRFQRNATIYILAHCGDNDIVLINLDNGNLWADKVCVSCASQIKQNEFTIICNYKQDSFTLIE